MSRHSEATQATPASTQDPTEHATPERILVPVDFSDCAAEVVAEAVKIARQTGASLELLHVIDLDGIDPQMPVPLSDDAEKPATAADLLEAEARTSLAKLADQARASEVPVNTTTVYGTPAEAIVEQTADLSVSMIVMGTHGRRGISRWVLGSVAEDVSRAVSVPVVTHRTVHKPHCEPASCAWCGSHVTAATRRIRTELDG